MPKHPDAPIRKLVSLSPGMVAHIDDYRFKHRLKSQTEAIRELLRAALDAAGPADLPRRGRKAPQ